MRVHSRLSLASSSSALASATSACSSPIRAASACSALLNSAWARLGLPGPPPAPGSGPAPSAMAAEPPGRSPQAASRRCVPWRCSGGPRRRIPLLAPGRGPRGSPTVAPRHAARPRATPRLPSGESVCQPGSPRPADRFLLHPAGRAGQEDVQVSGGHVERHGLVGPDALELGDAFTCHRLAAAAAGPAEIVQDPFQPQFGLRVAAGPESGRQEESLVRGASRSQVGGDAPYRPKTSISGKKGAKASCSWPRARPMAARSDRSQSFWLTVLRKKNLPASGSRPSQRAASTPRKCPLENSSTLPSMARTRRTTQSARAPTMCRRFAARVAVAEHLPVRPFLEDVLRRLALVSTVVPLEQVGIDQGGGLEGRQLTGPGYPQ